MPRNKRYAITARLETREHVLLPSWPSWTGGRRWFAHFSDGAGVLLLESPGGQGGWKPSGLKWFAQRGDMIVMSSRACLELRNCLDGGGEIICELHVDRGWRAPEMQ